MKLNRIRQKFAVLKETGRKGLVTFIMGGDPDLEAAQRVFEQLPLAGADIIEIGMPFSDPMADGPVIQAAGLRALRNGTTLKDVLHMVEKFRAGDNTTPVILMGYYNPVYRYGAEPFCEKAAQSGVDGVILVDLPPEEEEEFTLAASLWGINLIRLVTPTTDDARLSLLTQNAGGFLYYVSIAGVTGTKSAEMYQLMARVRHIKSQAALPVAVGFGIKTPKQAAEIGAFCDAVVVGSALVDALAASQETALGYVKSLRAALDGQ